jgi:hypothetical protein
MVVLTTLILASGLKSLLGSFLNSGCTAALVEQKAKSFVLSETVITQNQFLYCNALDCFRSSLNVAVF